tara:strand:- start:708 stop:1586 length:879 start_codon:yes stop_codon:yes gene_type:complete
VPFVHVNNIKLFYQSVGVGTTIVFIHGGYGGASSSVLPRKEPWIEGFKAQYNVITYDRRSAGKSSYPSSAHNMGVFVDDLKGLIDELSINKLFLIGSSAGGPVAIEYCLRYPDSLSGLILANTSARIWSHNGRVKHVEELRRRYALLQSVGPKKTYDLLNIDSETTPFYLLNQIPNPPSTEVAGQLMERQARIRALKNLLTKEERIRYYNGELLNLASYLDLDMTDLLKNIKVPTLVIHGDADTQVPYHLGVEMARHIDGSLLHTVAGAGHSIMQWEAAAEQIKTFCDELNC